MDIRWTGLPLGLWVLGTAEQDPKSDSMNLIARILELMARVFLLRGGRNSEPRKPELGLVENFVHMLGIDGEEAEADV